MLISPPFLPPRGNQTEDQWLDTAMSGGEPGHGAFPVSYLLEWHGGLHLTAPMGGNGVALPVRAVADGTVVFIRQRSDADSPDDPLNYGDGYTSDAVVVICHDSEIGATAAGQPTPVRFYSVYMHLHSIQPTVRLGRPLYRKDEIGQAGHIYGEPNVMHFEICCDDANLARLVGRATGHLSLATDGRTDALFGEMYFHLPAGTPIYGARPLPQFTQAMVQPAATAVVRGQPTTPAPAPLSLQAVHTTASEFVIGLRYAGGEGAAGQRGDAVLTTYRMSGEAEGTPLREAEAEYKLYISAKHISEAYPAAARPAVSAVYELLRFGRIVGPDALAPADVPHWREVSYPGGQGWVNLNAANVHKFSDADFPQWKGWALIDDDAHGDSRCDSAMLHQMIYGTAAAGLQPSRQQATAQLNSLVVQAKLARTVCKFPSEWDASTIDQRWAWLKTQSDENPEPLNEEDYAELKAHVQALCFPLPELFSAQWCFNPREFIKQFRRCYWLSGRELAQCIPRQCGLGATPWVTASARGENHRIRMSQMFGKYGALTTTRKVHFLAQIYIETGLLRTMREGGLGATNPAIPKAQYYAAFYGRGYMQLTWASNYDGYGTFRGFANHAGAYADARITQASTHTWSDFNPATQQPTLRQWSPRYDPDQLVTNDYACADSGGYYWISKTYRGTSDITRTVDLGMSSNIVGFVSWLVNGGGNGYVERQGFARFVYNVLGDEPLQVGNEPWLYPRLTPQLTGSFPPGNPTTTQTIQVNHARQTP